MMRYVLILFCLLAITQLGLAQPTIDGDASDWTGIAPSTDNTSIYSANTAGGLNEWIWKDAAGDNRTDSFGSFVDSTKQDILEFRISSDATNLYILAKFPANIDKTPGDGALQIQVSIRRQGSTATEEYLGGGVSDTRVPTSTSPGGGVPDARWDYLIISRAGSGNNNFTVWTTGFGSSSNTGNLQWNAGNGVFEGSIPWSSLGGSPGNETMAFTISLFRSNTSDGVFDTGADNSKGNCLDYLTTTAGNTYDALIPIDNGGTANEGRLDYAINIDFSNDQSLPVTLSSFTATGGDGVVELTWITEAEINNEAFILERSTDKTQFTPIAEIPGQGNSTERHEYRYRDTQVINGVTYYYRLADRDYSGTVTYHPVISVTPNPAGVLTAESSTIPDEFELYPNFPNPFNPSTTIRFAVTGSSPQRVQLHIFDLAGHKIATLVDANFAPGIYKVNWNARDITGSPLPSGVYLYQLKSGPLVKTRKMILMK